MGTSADSRVPLHVGWGPLWRHACVKLSDGWSLLEPRVPLHPLSKPGLWRLLLVARSNLACMTMIRHPGRDYPHRDQRLILAIHRRRASIIKHLSLKYSRRTDDGSTPSRSHSQCTPTRPCEATIDEHHRYSAVHQHNNGCRTDAGHSRSNRVSIKLGNAVVTSSLNCL